MKTIILIFALIITTQLSAKLITYQYPESIRKSAFYQVFVKQGDVVKESFVHVSECPDGPFTDHKIWVTQQDRSMSFSQFDFSGEPVQVSVTKLFGTSGSNVEITPSRYGILVDEFDGRTVKFTLEKPEYVSVRFVCDDNTDEFDNIKNGLMIFADEPETIIPSLTDKDVSVYGPDCDFANAKIIYFPPGEHNLKDLLPNGLIMLHDDQSLYISGGAYVYGMVNGTASYNARIFGRGVLSGFKHEFHYDGQRQLVEMDPFNYRLNINRGGNHTIEGVTFMESINHTLVVPDNSLVKDVKFIAWACNNDGLRSGDHCVIDHVFMKLSDDYFYGTHETQITRSVLWPMFNGATIQLGWGSNGSEYSGTRFINNDIINPEWDWIGANTGFIASQLKPDAKINHILIEDLHIDGDINALAALDFAIVDGKEYAYTGKISDITFRNVEVNGSQIWWGSRGWDDYERVETQLSKDYQINEKFPAKLGKSFIRGMEGPNGRKATVENITFENVRMNGEWITDKNYQKYFDIDENTTKNIQFILNKEMQFSQPGLSTSTKEYSKKGIGASLENNNLRLGRECGWLEPKDVIEWSIDVPDSGEFEIRYSLMPIYRSAQVEITDGRISSIIDLEPPTDNAFGLIKKVAPIHFRLNKGINNFKMIVKKGLVYADLFEIVADSLAPGTDDFVVYTHWHGIIRYGDTNWKSANLNLGVTKDNVKVYNGSRQHSGPNAAPEELTIALFDSKGKQLTKQKSGRGFVELPILKLNSAANFVQLTDNKSYWIVKQFIK